VPNKQERGQGRAQDLPRLLGERLCLHFVNTVEGPISEHPDDFLRGYGDLVRWSWHAGAIGQDDVARLLEAASAQPGRAAAVFTRALVLRDAADRVFRAVARDGDPAPEDLDRLRDEYVAALGHARLGPGEWSWAPGGAELDRPIWPVARSAVEVLTGDDLSRVRMCPGAGDCGWLFYDTSRNGRRRWCSMEGCGSRVKMRRHYATHRS
jgi:predicted RNA-binding Zn ribbon-like protein